MLQGDGENPAIKLSLSMMSATLSSAFQKEFILRERCGACAILECKERDVLIHHALHSEYSKLCKVGERFLKDSHCTSGARRRKKIDFCRSYAALRCECFISIDAIRHDGNSLRFTIDKLIGAPRSNRTIEVGRSSADYRIDHHCGGQRLPTRMRMNRKQSTLENAHEVESEIAKENRFQRQTERENQIE
jgi:hypothetical protein